jgi:uncharacterized membrane protein HdeD (DUF308 family)
MNEAKKAAVMVIALGLAMQVVGFVLNAVLASPTLAHSFALLISFGGAIVVFGCFRLARAKRRSWLFGLLGLLSVLGAAIVWFVPDKRSTEAA